MGTVHGVGGCWHRLAAYFGLGGADEDDRGRAAAPSLRRAAVGGLVTAAVSGGVWAAFSTASWPAVGFGLAMGAVSLALDGRDVLRRRKTKGP
jgi:hypothetical protein